MKNSIKSLVAVAALALAAAASAAAPSPYYVQGAIGAGHISVPGEEGVNVDRTSFGGKATLGYKVTENFALETGYLSFGKAKASVGDADFGYNGSLASKGFTLGVAGFYPVTKEVTLVGRAGALFSKNKFSESVSYYGETYSGSESESHTVPYVGVGVEYALDKNWSVNGGVDFARVKFGGESFSGRLYTVGVGYQF